MTTIQQNLRIRQGETWSHVDTYLDSAGSAVDLSGYTARMSMKRTYNGSAIAYLSTGSDANGGTIALGGAAGTITKSMTAAQTDALLTTGDLADLMIGKTYKSPEFLIYDLEIVSGAGSVTRVREGKVEIHRSATS